MRDVRKLLGAAPYEAVYTDLSQVNSSVYSSNDLQSLKQPSTAKEVLIQPFTLLYPQARRQRLRYACLGTLQPTPFTITSTDLPDFTRLDGSRPLVALRPGTVTPDVSVVLDHDIASSQHGHLGLLQCGP